MELSGEYTTTEHRPRATGLAVGEGGASQALPITSRRGHLPQAQEIHYTLQPTALHPLTPSPTLGFYTPLLHISIFLQYVLKIENKFEGPLTQD